MKTNNKGFSLVELIVVIAIMAILAAVAIPTFASFITKANEASDKQFVDDLKYSVELANTEFGKEVTDFDVECDTAGEITSVTYTVDGVTIVIDVDAENGPVATTTSTGDKADKIKAAASTVIDTMDWDYGFKSEKYVTEYKPTT